MVTIPDLGWGSVIGNSLDSGVTYLPYGKDFMAPCGMEVVLADGEIAAHRAWARWRATSPGTCTSAASARCSTHCSSSRNFGIVTRMGCLAAAAARGVHGADAAAVGPRRHRARGRHHPRTAARRTSCRACRRSATPGHRGPAHAAVAVVRRRRARSPTRVQERIADASRRRAAGRCASASGATPTSWISGSRRSARRSSAIPGARGPGDPLQRATTSRRAGPRPTTRCRRAFPNLDINTMTGWYGGEEGGHIGFSPVLPLTSEACLRGP